MRSLHDDCSFIYIYIYPWYIGNMIFPAPPLQRSVGHSLAGGGRTFMTPPPLSLKIHCGGSTECVCEVETSQYIMITYHVYNWCHYHNIIFLDAMWFDFSRIGYGYLTPSIWPSQALPTYNSIYIYSTAILRPWSMVVYICFCCMRHLYIYTVAMPNESLDRVPSQMDAPQIASIMYTSVPEL
jgi:hypothetical protein